MKLFIDSADPKDIADCAATKGLAAFLDDAKRAGAKLKAE